MSEMISILAMIVPDFSRRSSLSRTWYAPPSSAIWAIVTPALDNGGGRGSVEHHHPTGVVHEAVWMVHRLQSAGRDRRGIVQYHRTDDYLGSVRARHALQDAGTVLLCHTRGIRSGVSVPLLTLPANVQVNDQQSGRMGSYHPSTNAPYHLLVTGDGGQSLRTVDNQQYPLLAKREK